MKNTAEKEEIGQKGEGEGMERLTGKKRRTMRKSGLHQSDLCYNIQKETKGKTDQKKVRSENIPSGPENSESLASATKKKRKKGAKIRGIARKGQVKKS